MTLIKEIQYQLKDYTNEISFGGVSRSKIKRSQELQSSLSDLSTFSSELAELDPQLDHSEVISEDDDFTAALNAVSIALEGGSISIELGGKLANERFTPSLPTTIYGTNLQFLALQKNRVRLSTSRLASNVKKQIHVGQGIVLYDSEDNQIEKSIVLIQASNYIECNYKSEIEPSYGQIYRWWAPYSNSSVWLTEDIFEEAPPGTVAILQAAAIRTNKIGRVGWSLYYQENLQQVEVEVAKGSDGVIPGVCQLSKEGCRFKEGVYTLRVRTSIVFRVEGQKLFKRWILEEPSELLLAKNTEMKRNDQ